MKPMLVAAAVLLCAGMPLSVAAQTEAPYDVAADWLHTPTAEDIAAATPTASIKEGLDGRAVLRCIASVEGALKNCVVLSESPAGKGFGGAALTLAPRFQVRPAQKAGRPVESLVNVPIVFNGRGTPTGSYLPGESTMGMKKVIRTVPWLRTPSFADMAAAFPEKAKTAGKTGRAVLECAFKADGTLKNCGTVTEEPGGYGFGAAARKLAANFVTQPTLPNGDKIADIQIHVPFTFNAEMAKGVQAPMTTPVWVSMPTPQMMSAAFPAKARAAKVFTSRVVLNCVIGPEGGLTQCSVAVEAPKDLGFGDAALAVARAFRVRKWTDDGVPTAGAPIKLPLKYEITVTDGPATPAAPTVPGGG
ncbi:hypothetical protein BH11PSE2_BH11PSE2_06170 [soil metagenome]